MKLARKHRVYAAVIASLLLALWLRPTPDAPATVLPATPRKPTVAPASAATPAEGWAPLGAREARMPAALFGMEAPPPAPAPAMVELPPAGPPPPPDLQLLGWVLADQIAWVSVSVGNTGYTLQPGEQVEALYRYDGVREGVATFTFLPDGTPRQYPISDVQISE